MSVPTPNPPRLATVVLLLTAVGAFPPSAVNAIEPVGSFGNLNRLKIEGAEVIGESGVRDAMRSDWQVQLALTPSARLDNFLRVLNERLTRAYHDGGFPEAKVRVHAIRGQPKTLLLQIVEGKRYFQRDVIVHGADGLAEELVRELTKAGSREIEFPLETMPDGTMTIQGWKGKKPENKDPAWTRGEPATFVASRWDSLRRTIRQWLFTKGYQNVRFTAEPLREKGHVDLLINVLDLGPKTILGRIEVRGVKRHSPQEVIRFLGLKKGQPFGLNEQRSVHRRLLNSGRFLKHVVALSPASGKDHQATLSIDLIESATVPKLTEKLTERDRIVLKLRDWLADPTAWTRDLVVELKSPDAGHFRTYFSSTQGALVHVDPSGQKIAGKFTVPAMSAVATTKQIGFVLHASGRHFIADSKVGCIRLVIELGPDDDPVGEQPHSINVGVGFSSNEQAGSGPLELAVQLAPVAFLELTRRPGHSAQVKAGILEIVTPSRRVSIDAKTGALIRLSPKGEDGESVRFVEGALEQALGKMNDRVRGRNEYDAKHPVGRFIRWTVTETLQNEQFRPDLDPARRKAAVALARQLLTDDVLAPLDGRDAEPEEDEKEFKIPLDPEQVVAELHGALAGLMLPPIDEVFEYGTWPWTIAREALMIPLKASPYSRDEIARLATAQDVGPVGYLVIARLSAQVNRGMSGAFARRGLAALSAEGFQKDCDVLLRSDCSSAKALRGILSHLQKIDPNLLPAGTPLQRFVRALNHEPGKPFDRSPAAQDEVWKLVMDAVEKELKRINEAALKN